VICVINVIKNLIFTW